MSFNIGEEVICVDAETPRSNDTPCWLVKGKTYVVLGKVWCGCCIVVEPPVNGMGWGEERFRRPTIDESNITIEDKVDA